MNTDMNRMDIKAMQADLAALTANVETMQRDIAEIKKTLKETLEKQGDRLSELEANDAASSQRWTDHYQRHKHEWTSHEKHHRTENRTITALATTISSAVSGVISWFRS